MLANATLRALATTEISEDQKLLLVEASIGLTLAKAAEGRLLCQIRRTEGEQVQLKILIFVLRHFVDSSRVPNKLDGADIIELAEGICQKYTHESLEDILLALKDARSGGTTLYNKLDQSDIWQALEKYFERKAKWFENEHRDQKSCATSLDSSAVAQLSQVAPKLGQQLSLRIDPAHPNAELLRSKLTITNAKEARGLVSAEEAQQSRSDVAAANLRKPRADWQPGAEAQRRMDARNREEDKRYR